MAFNFFNNSDNNYRLFFKFIIDLVRVSISSFFEEFSENFKYFFSIIFILIFEEIVIEVNGFGNPEVNHRGGSQILMIKMTI